jgi:CcmD family protein
VSEWNFIVGAYALTWVAILGYTAYLARRVSRAAAALKANESVDVETNR